MGITVSKGPAVTATFATPQEIIISHTDDSIRLGDGTDLANVTGAGALQVDGSAVTQPISAASLPLPSGAATAANQTTLITHVDGIESLLTSLVTNTADIYGFQTTTPLGSNQSFDSGILSLSPQYSQVQTNITADQNGTINIYWYRDLAGTDLLRTISLPFTASDGWQTFAAPAFTPYVKYTFTNGSSAQSDFYYDTKFLSKPITAQILTSIAPISERMVGLLTRSVIVGKSSSGGGDFVNVKVNPSGTLETNANQGGTWNIGTLTSITNDVSTIAKVYTTNVDEASSTVTYVGKALPGTSAASASWQIFKMTVSGTTTTMTFADGNSNFDNVWDNRASLSYS